MPERKNQHYVPKHYLRAWASDKKLNVLPLSAGKIFPDTTNSVCSRNYFYGKPPVVEDELANLDSYHARPLKELRSGDDLTDLSQRGIKLLLSFITTQRTRSRATKEDIKQGYDFLKDAVEDDMGANRYEDQIEWKDDLDEEEKKEKLVEVHLLGVHHFLIAQGVFGYIGIKDLDAVMLCNVTAQEFVVSDAPMVLDIPQYKHQLGLVPAGMGNRGLQIYCPVDRHRILLLYDHDVYRFDQNSKGQVLVKNEEVVDELNLLQFHNAESIVMFNESSEDYILDLYDRIDEVRRRKEITTTRETENMGEFKIEEAPAYQVPKISPSLPGYTTLDGVRYMKRRPSSEIERGRQLIRTVFNEVNWGSDIAVIYCIKLLEELLNL
jgi:hypothetical protein